MYYIRQTLSSLEEDLGMRLCTIDLDIFAVKYFHGLCKPQNEIDFMTDNNYSQHILVCMVSQHS